MALRLTGEESVEQLHDLEEKDLLSNILLARARFDEGCSSSTDTFIADSKRESACVEELKRRSWTDEGISQSVELLLKNPDAEIVPKEDLNFLKDRMFQP